MDQAAGNRRLKAARVLRVLGYLSLSAIPISIVASIGTR